MKLIIAGSRDIDEELAYGECVKFRIKELIVQTEIVSGGASGPDTAGEMYAAWYGLPVKVFPADWDKYGKSAGPIRNRQMAEYADALLLIWDGKSPGSRNMKSEMKKLGKPVFEVIMKTGSDTP